MAVNVRITKELKNPTDVGVHYRLLCMTGPNKGNVYYLIGKRVVIGRGESADIQIMDTKISREHGELAFSENSYILTDLGAQNGIIVNDHKIKQKKLIEGEKIVIGQTVFKYNIIKISHSLEMMIADANPDSAMSKEIKKGVRVKVPPKSLINESPVNINTHKTVKNPANSKSKFLIFGVVLIGAIFILLDEEDKKSAPSVNVEKIDPMDLEIFNESVIVKTATEDPETKKKLQALIHSGRREFREGNYFRAMEEFRLALLISPNNGQASFYLSKAKQRLDDEIRKNFEKGGQEQDAKKYKSAIVSFCSVVQLIKEYPNDERYKTAMTNLSAIESALGMEKGEIKCFEEKSAISGN